MSSVESSACPTCGEDGVKACVDESSRELDFDHPERPPFFSPAVRSVLNRF